MRQHVHYYPVLVNSNNHLLLLVFPTWVLDVFMKAVVRNPMRFFCSEHYSHFETKKHQHETIII